MKIKFLFVSICAASILFAGCSRKDADDEKAKEAKVASPAASHVSRGTNGEVIVSLDKETQQRMGLQTEALAATQLNAETKAYGRVLDPTPLSSAVADLVSAAAAAEASQKELARLKTLAAQTNTSARALESAQASAQHDMAQVTAARLHILTTWGAAVADQKNLPEFVQSLAGGKVALVRVDLPAGETLKATPANARLEVVGETQPIEARFLSQAANVDPQTQGQGFLFLVEANTARLSPGAAVTAHLSTDGESQKGVIVPRAAVIRHEGAAWIYLESGETNFIRRAISLGPPLEKGWFVSAGVSAGDSVVTTGTQAVFSEELNSSGFMSGERD